MERIICILIGYACGLFQTSYLLGKLYHTDIRQHGSGNAGTTNAFRTLGKKAGAFTLLGDILKCVVAVLITTAIFKNRCPEILPLLKIYTAAGSILGHNFPFYMGFRGGKGIAASAGMMIAFDFRIFLIGLAVFAALFLAFHYVSLCSLSCYVAALVCMIIFGQLGFYGMDQPHRTEMYLVMTFLTVMAFWRHHENIKRLLAGNERKIFLTSSKKGQE